MKNKILLFLGFSIFWIAIYLVYFYKKYDYSKERMKDYVRLLKDANEILFEKSKDNEREMLYEITLYEMQNYKSEYFDNYMKINGITKKIMLENQQNIFPRALENYVKKIKSILHQANMSEYLDIEDVFVGSILPTKEYEKYTLLEKKLYCELIKIQIYRCQAEILKKTLSCDWGGGGLGELKKLLKDFKKIKL